MIKKNENSSNLYSYIVLYSLNGAFKINSYSWMCINKHNTSYLLTEK